MFSGEREYRLTLPVAPGAGAVGRVRAVGPDATRLAPHDWVLCDLTIRSRDDPLTPDITLQGLSGRGEGGLHLQRHFGQGSFAEQLLVPTENVFALGSIDPRQAGAWTALGVCLVPYGGQLAGDLEPDETILISGATGNFGGAAVAVAGCVIRDGHGCTSSRSAVSLRPGAPLRRHPDVAPRFIRCLHCSIVEILLA